MLHPSTETFASRQAGSDAPAIGHQQHAPRAGAGRGFRHDALFYDHDDQFVEHVAQFVREGVQSREPVLVVVQAPKIARLRGALDDVVDHVQFADMADVGANPARIIPAWVAFIEQHGQDTRVRGVGEPLYVERLAAERAECHVHEALLNTSHRAHCSEVICTVRIPEIPMCSVH